MGKRKLPSVDVWSSVWITSCVAWCSDKQSSLLISRHHEDTRPSPFAFFSHF